MAYANPLDFSLEAIETPAYVVDARLIRENCSKLRDVATASGAKILLAQKAFSMFSLYPLIGEYLDGCTASSLHEAKLGYEEMHDHENHIFSPAYRENELKEIAHYCDHLVFNSPAQAKRFAEPIRRLNPSISLGLRLNPQHRTQTSTPLYDPCAPFSRLGCTIESYQNAFGDQRPDYLEGFHMHTLCEQNSDDLVTTVSALEQKFAHLFTGIKWLNLGGGHHITRKDYDLDALIHCIQGLRKRYGCEVYLEPGEAIALNAGYLVTEVLDFVRNDMDIAILDSSAECHMPDVLAMPYQPPLYAATAGSDAPHTYRLSSATCLAGDVIGDYSFEHTLAIGDRLVFGDMAIYTMVKNNTFNGINLPAIYVYDEPNGLQLVRRFGYEDFRSRLS